MENSARRLRPIAIAVAIAFAVTLVSTRAHADPSRAADEETEDDAKPAAGVEVAIASAWLWRGLSLARGPTVEPEVWASARGATVAISAGAPLEGRARAVALVGAASQKIVWRRVAIEPTLLVYDAPARERRPLTAEASLEVSIALGADVRVVSTHFVDVGRARGAYFGEAGAEWARSFDRWTLRARADVGWANRAFDDAYFARNTGGLTLAEAHAQARYAIGGGVYAAVLADGSALLAEALRRRGESGVLGSFGTAIGAEL